MAFTISSRSHSTFRPNSTLSTGVMVGLKMLPVILLVPDLVTALMIAPA